MNFIAQGLFYLASTGALGAVLTASSRRAVAAEAALTRKHALASHALQLATIEADRIATKVLATHPATGAAAYAAVRQAVGEELPILAPDAHAAAAAVHGSGWYGQLDAVVYAAVSKAAVRAGLPLAATTPVRPAANAPLFAPPAASSPTPPPPAPR